MKQVRIVHWGGGEKTCDAQVADNGKRVSVHFAYGHWIDFLLETGLQVGRRKASALDDGKGRLSTWRIARDDLKKLRELATWKKAPKKEEIAT